MENASKALIIAGAILIAILLISVGIMVMNSINKPLDETASEADSQAVQMFNSKFTIYDGTKKTASEVNQLLLAIQASNGVDPKHIIYATHRNGNGSNQFINTKPRNDLANNSIFKKSYNHTIGDLIASITNDKIYTIQTLIAQEEDPNNSGKYGVRVKGEFVGATEKGYVCFVRIIDDGLDANLN